MVDIKRLVKCIVVMVCLNTTTSFGDVSNMSMAKPHTLDVPILLETTDQYQICEPHNNHKSFDCLSFNRISFRTKSNGDIIAGITDIVYIRSKNNAPKRVEMSSIVHVNCANSSISVQLDPNSKWTHWEYVKKSELIRNVMNKICELQEAMTEK